MSLGKTLFSQIETAISSFIEKIAEKYKLDKDDLEKLWNEAGVSKPKPAKSILSTTVNMDDLSRERLVKASKAELSALCKSKGCKCTGTKDVLIARLLGEDEPSKGATASKVGTTSKGATASKTEKKSTTKTVSKTTSKKAPASATSSIEVLNKITKNVPTLPIRTNAFGRLEHPETRFVFDNKKSKKVIGKQEDDGTVSELTEEDIEECKRFKFAFEMPKNLEKENLDQVKIEEVDDESDVEVVEEDEEEVEVEESDAEEEEADE